MNGNNYKLNNNKHKIRHIFILLFLSFFSFAANAQIKIDGRITDKKNKPLEAISVALKDTYDGAITNNDGYFSFTTSEKGKQIISMSSAAYETQDREIIIGDSSITINLVLKEKVNELNAVTVTTGTFAGMGGKKGVTVLSSMDVLTTPGSNADISKALQILPGVQQINNQEGLFVRGGDAYEAKQFVDGSYVANPYAGGLPNISGRSRFNPTLFKGFAFSTGGYSALYGEALSSALIMETIDMPEQSEQGLFVSPLVWGANAQQLAKNNKTSWGFNYMYANLGLYYALVKQTPDFFKMPQMHNADANFRIKTKNGI
ncbi:MAG: TonB-dependent receptor, partial [Chitinophagaceae bacterium]|nr:TonB-dependent receptor [Chitinophagaceae bacterium]